ncbi:flagellar biosynthesis protein FlhB [Sulfuriferula thiophila]|uniref:flagellar biosynthesis protein FlhB n=1 Tax=Sulfuriferula thiophila TaxID=1781211 RepID=UPI000F610A21|nr:flagellar biosynthesis protein FlhB [Sulfuriferula thiophila]
MAEDSDLEKTEQASPQRLEKAREEGDVPRSRELATFTGLLAAGGGIWLSGDQLVRQLETTLISGMSFTRAQAYDFSMLYSQLARNIVDLMLAFAPLAGVLILVALLSPALIGGWLFSTKALVPNFGRMNPIKGMTNMVSSRALVELIKAVAKATLVGVIAWMVIAHEQDAVMSLSVESIHQSTAHMSSMIWFAFISMTAGLGLIVLIDAPYQMWHYADKLKMTREEVKQEAREADGDPQIKAKIRAQQREMSRRRMMAEVPTADVVVTNPTHYAVALKYADGAMRAPIVVAKGADEVAAKIRELAAEHNIPTLEAPPLARALYRHAELGTEIPEALYTAVAEILAYVFQLRAYRKGGGVAPVVPSDIAVPPELDPLNAPVPALLADGEI